MPRPGDHIKADAEFSAWVEKVKVNNEADWPAPTCWSCRFWTRNYGRIAGEDDAQCRRHAPAPRAGQFILGEGEQLTEPEWKWEGNTACWWPVTQAQDWCGDHQPLPAKGPARGRRIRL